MAKEYDPLMHTAEHVLNRTMVRMFGCGRCFSSHLNADKSKCDYRFPRPLTDAEAESIEETVNAALGRNLAVEEKFLPHAEAAKLVDLSRLPEAVVKEAAGRGVPEAEIPVRLIFVGDYDICPCIGAHAANTGEVGRFRLVSHSFAPAEAEESPGVLRLRFKLQR